LRAYAADNSLSIASKLTAAVSDMEAAYLDAEGRSSGTTLSSTTGGVVLTPGVHTSNAGFNINDDISLKGRGSDNDPVLTDVFIIQIDGDLLQAADTKVILTDGAKAENVFWQVAGNYVNAGATTVVANAMVGNLLVKEYVTFGSGSSLEGRVFAQKKVTLQDATITCPVVAGCQSPQAPTVSLLTAANYAILAKSGISNSPPSVINGDIGVSPIGAAAITGINLAMDTFT
jgi:hypothetical protein